MVPVSPSGERPARIAVVGLGAVSQSVHLPLLVRRWDLFEVVAVVDLSPSRVRTIADRYGVPGRFTALADLLAAHAAGEITLDGVLLATSGSHGSDTLAVVRAGLPVLVEKPLALSRAEVAAIAAVDGALVHVGYMKEHDPATQRAREELAGTRLRAVTVEVLHPSGEAQLDFARLLPPVDDIDAERLTPLLAGTEQALDAAVGDRLDPRWRGAYAGVVLGSLVHDIALLRHTVGGIERVDSAHRWGEQGADPGSFELSGTVAGGARVHVGWHYLPDYPDYRETVTFHHDTGSLSLVFGVPYLLNVPTVLEVVGRAGEAGMSRAVHTWNQQEGFENELVAFGAMIRTGRPCASGPAEGLADLAVAQQVLAALGRQHGFEVGGEAAAQAGL